LSSIENLHVNGGVIATANVSNIVDLTSVEFDAQGANLALTLSAAQTAKFSNNNGATIYNETLIYGATDTAATVTLNGVGKTGTASTVDVQGAALATLGLNSTAANNITLTNSAGAKLAALNISGDKAITVTEALAGLKTIDASAATGNVTVNVTAVADNDITFTGGNGNDTLDLGAFLTKADKINGGDGTDTLAITAASVATVNGYVVADKAVLNDNISNIEVLKVTNALAAAVDATRFDSINSYVFGGAFTNTLSAVKSGVSVELNVAANNVAVEITDATLAGNNSDVVNLNLNDTAGTAGGMNINSTTKAGTVSTGFNTLSVANTSSALDKVVFTGNVGADISAVALVNSIAEVDASAMTVASTANGVKVSIAAGGTNGVKITGSAGIDTLAGGDAADIINGGAGNDIITGGKGNDVLTGGAGNDTFQFAAGDSGITSTLFDTITDYSNGTVVGTTDKIVFSDGAGIVGVSPLAGFTLNNGVATKSGATLDDFITAVQGAAATAESTYAFVVGSDTYVYNIGATAATTDDTLIKLVGVVGASVVTADTVVANEIFIG